MIQIQLFFRLVKRTYIPGPFRKEYAVAAALGSICGGFIGFIIANGWSAKGWVVMLSACIGMVVGTAFTLSVVPKKSS